MQKRIITLLCAVGLAVSPLTAMAQQLNLRPDAPARYTVRQGDTLWGISGKYLHRPWLWPRLWNANRNTVRNPHLIYPGQVLVLTYVNGQPRLSVEGGGIPTIKLRPGVREISSGYGISTINVDFYRMFMQHPQIMDAQEARNAPRLVAGPENRALFGLGDRVYAANLPTSGDYLIYRIDRELKDPDTRQPLGLRVVFVGKASTVPTFNTAAAANVAQALQITEQSSEIRTGDYLLPFNGKEVAFNMMPHAPEQPVRAKVIDVMDGISEAGAFSTITLNKGLNDGLDKGTVVALYTPSRVVGRGENSTTIPSSEIGLAMVYNAAANVSSAIVLESISNISVGYIAAEPGHDLDTLAVPAAAQNK